MERRRRTTDFGNAHATAAETCSPRGQGEAYPRKTPVAETSGVDRGENPTVLVRGHETAQSLGKKDCSALQKYGVAAGVRSSRDDTSLCSRNLAVGKPDGRGRDAQISVNVNAQTNEGRRLLSDRAKAPLQDDLCAYARNALYGAVGDQRRPK